VTIYDFLMVAIVSIALSCTFSSYLMMNNIVTLKSRLTSFKAIGNGTILKLEYQGTVFYSHSMATVALSCIVFEVKRNICQKSQIFIPALAFDAP